MSADDRILKTRIALLLIIAIDNFEGCTPDEYGQLVELISTGKIGALNGKALEAQIIELGVGLAGAITATASDPKMQSWLDEYMEIYNNPLTALKA